MHSKKPKHWQALFGVIEVEDDAINFLGSLERDNADGKDYPMGGMILCDLPFVGGAMVADIEYSDAQLVPGVQFLLYRNALDNSQIRVGVRGGEVDFEPSMANVEVVIFDGTKTTDRLSVPARGDFFKFEATKKYELRVVNFGSLVDIYINGIHMLRHFAVNPWPRSQCGLWFRGSGKVTVRNFRVIEQEKKAFVVMQFTEPFNNIFNDVIKPVALELGVKAERADDVSGPGLIIADIVRQMQSSDVIIADISPLNANVFYEVGYAHAINKPTILLAERGTKLPFDVSGMRALIYENSISGKLKLEEGLRKHLGATLGID